jgi:flagellar motility protein MotE (MotC chaperone)
MTRANDIGKLPRTGGCSLRISILLLTVAVIFGIATPGSAQQGWVPTVATAPGGSFSSSGASGRMTSDIDPRYFPAPNSSPAQTRNSLPQGAWSPIITGGIPLPAAEEPTPVNTPAVTSPDRIVAPLELLTPIRPLSRKAVIAAEGAQNSGGARETAPETLQPTGGAAPASTEADSDTLFKKPGPLDTPPPNATAAQQYCFNTVDTAADARFAWQAKKIKEMEAALDKRAQQLEAKTEEYKQWLQRRDEFSRKAHEKLVGFYSRMRPDAAALQLASLDEEMAAAVVTKLETKVASQIMGEMDPERAAKIATIISGAAKIPPDRRRATGQSQGVPSGPPNGETQPEQPRS